MANLLARRQRPLIKSADLGGNSLGDMPFEEAFSNIAHAFLGERAPRLLDYEVGFQLLRRDPDRNRAAAVCAFKAGPLWLLVPMFFVDGKLLCSSIYAKNQNCYVPLKENWINFLLSKKPVESGNGAGRDLKRLGVRQPDMSSILRSPHKYASDRSADIADNPMAYANRQPPESLGSLVEWSRGERAALAVEAAAIEKRANLKGEDAAAFARLDAWEKVASATIVRSWALPEFEPILPGLIRKGGLPILEKLAAWAEQYPILQRGIAATYGEGVLAKAAAEIEDRPAPRPKGLSGLRLSKNSAARSLGDPTALGRLQVIKAAELDHRSARLLSDEDRTALLVDGALIKDARSDDEVSEAYPVPLRLDEGITLSNPHDSGIYEVLTSDGTYARCLVVLGPHGAYGPEEQCLVSEIGKSRRPTLVHPSRVMVRKKYKGWNEWIESLPVPDDLSASDATRVLISPSGAASAPFTVRRSAGARDGRKGYDVWFDEGRGRDSKSLYSVPPARTTTPRAFGPEKVWLGGPGSSFRSADGGLTAPAGSRLYTVHAGSEDRDYDDDGCCDDSPLAVGSQADIEAALMAKTSSLTVDSRHAGVSISGVGYAGRADALLALVADHGFRKEAAAEILDLAAAAGGTLELRVKKAYGYGGPALGEGPSAPPAYDEQSIASSETYGPYGSSASLQTPYARSSPVDELIQTPESQGGPDPYNPAPDPQMIGMAQRASQQGQREVVDASVVGSLLRATSDEKLVDEHIQPLMKAIDSLAKLDIAGAWHPERLEDRYGKANARDIREAITNNFDTLGDLALELRMKTIEADPAAAAMDNDIEASANQ